MDIVLLQMLVWICSSCQLNIKIDKKKKFATTKSTYNTEYATKFKMPQMPYRNLENQRQNIKEYYFVLRTLCIFFIET